jgi:uncharacterized YccA/Bax inhibitor family protein
MMSNPIFSDKNFREGGRGAGTLPAPVEWHPPVDDGPATPWPTATDHMSVRGVVSATTILLGLLLISAAFGWAAVPAAVEGQAVKFPGVAMIGVLIGLAAVVGCMFRPNLARYLAPVYALAEGYFVGAISKAYETYQHGVVVQAAGATVAVFAVMLFLYSSRIIKVTDRFRRIVVGATVGIMGFYLVSIVINLVGGGVSFLHSTSLFGIGFSFLVAGVAAFNLALDFDFIERGAKGGLPKNMEWMAALGLLVTIVWLYLEVLRLLSKLRSR